MANNIDGLMDTTLSKIKEMVDVNTIIGEQIVTPDGTIIIPVSKVSYGFAAGGSDLPTKRENKDCFGGGSGAGITVTPVGFLTITKDGVKMLPIENYNDATDRVVGMVPEVIDKINGIIKENRKEKKEKKEAKL